MNWGKKWGNFGVDVMHKMRDDYNNQSNYKSNDNNTPKESFFSTKNLLGNSFDMWWKMRK